MKSTVAQVGKQDADDEATGPRGAEGLPCVSGCFGAVQCGARNPQGECFHGSKEPQTQTPRYDSSNAI